MIVKSIPYGVVSEHGGQSLVPSGKQTPQTANIANMGAVHNFFL